MTLDEHVQQWWERLSADDRKALKAAAAEDRMDGDTVRLLIGTRCPVGPVGTKWESQPDFGWTWPGSVRTFVNAQDG
jgi:hypothetical protein